MFFENRLIMKYITELKNSDVIVFSDVSIKKFKSYIRKTNPMFPFVIYAYLLFYNLGINLPLFSLIKKFMDNVIILVQNDNNT